MASRDTWRAITMEARARLTSKASKKIFSINSVGKDSKGDEDWPAAECGIVVLVLQWEWSSYVDHVPWKSATLVVTLQREL
jgi:hypothetical protein